jgi:NDP-sugar pyrophosphorylase family protein
VKAVLLAAGAGTRLGPLTLRVPKPLVRVAGEPLLAHQLRYLAASGVTDLAVNVHHHAEMIETYLDEVDPPLRIRVYREAELRGTAGALFPMSEFLTTPFLVLYGDVVTDVDLRSLLDGARGLATLAYYRSADVRGKGVLELDGTGRIVRFVEKPPSRSGTRSVNAGIYALDPAIRRFIPPRGDFGFDVWPALTAAGEAIYGFEVDGYVLDMGSPEALRRLEHDVAAGRVPW